MKSAVVYVGIVWLYLLLWPIVGISLHHDYSSPDQLFMTPTPACQYSIVIQGPFIEAELKQGAGLANPTRALD
jgi:hypothetical protein